MSKATFVEFEGEWPKNMRTRFHRDLGVVSPLLSILDAAVRHFASEIQASQTPDKTLRKLLSQNGAGKIYLDATCLPSAIGQLHLAHIAYVIARADHHCFELRMHKNVRGETRAAVPKKGDFLRWTVGLLLANQIPHSPELTFPPSDETMLSVFPAETLKLVDYYRMCRNEELHDEAAGSAKSGSREAFQALPVTEIKSRFGVMPNAPDSLTIKDAVLCSKAWQDTSLHLCRLLVWKDLAIQLVSQRFGNLPAGRRRNGAMQFLQIECLWSNAQSKDILHELGWSA